MASTKRNGEFRVYSFVPPELEDKLDRLAALIAPPGAKPRESLAVRAAILEGIDIALAKATHDALRPRGDLRRRHAGRP